MTSIRSMTASDWSAVRAIYEAGIATGNATFETSAPDWAHWDASHLATHRFVAVDGDEVVGWTALSPVSDRCAHAGVVEHSVLVHADRRGGIWPMKTGIFPENAPSLALHARCGSG